MEGKGFEPTVEALFGTNGFFPDTVMKTMYFVSDNVPATISSTMERIIPALRRDRIRVKRFFLSYAVNTSRQSLIFDKRVHI